MVHFSTEKDASNSYFGHGQVVMFSVDEGLFVGRKCFVCIGITRRNLQKPGACIIEIYVKTRHDHYCLNIFVDLFVFPEEIGEKIIFVVVS